jgi:hypothetical protein
VLRWHNSRTWSAFPSRASLRSSSRSWKTPTSTSSGGSNNSKKDNGIYFNFVFFAKRIGNRPRKNWVDTVHTNFEDVNMTWEEAGGGSCERKDDLGKLWGPTCCAGTGRTSKVRCILSPGSWKLNHYTTIQWQKTPYKLNAETRYEKHNLLKLLWLLEHTTAVYVTIQALRTWLGTRSTSTDHLNRTDDI